MEGLSLYWHDYETFGDNPRRDRPAQFAGVRTDLDLNQIGDPLMLYCKPAPDFVPQPRACLITGITPQLCLDQGLPEYEFARIIQAQMAASGTISAGYNTFSFDSEFTRFMLYRNLADPYAHEWQNGCARWDILDMMRTAYAFKPEGIAWPKKESGGTSFKLEDLTAANGLKHEAAHDALSDVYGTIELARLVKRLYPDLYRFCLSMRSKDAVLSQMGLGSNKPFVHISWMGSSEHGGINVMLPLGVNPYNKNDVVSWDLSQDPTPLLDMSEEEIRLRLFSKRDDLPPGVDRLAMRAISINKAPVVIRGISMLTPTIINRWSIDIEAIKRNATALAAVCAKLHVPDMLAKVYKRTFEQVDPDEDLYGGFINSSDREIFNAARRADPERLSGFSGRLTEPRTNTLLFRYRARNFPGTLSGLDHREWNAHIRSKVILGENGHYTVSAMRREIESLLPNVDARGRGILVSLESYAESLAATTGQGEQGAAPVDAEAESVAVPAAM